MLRKLSSWRAGSWQAGSWQAGSWRSAGAGVAVVLTLALTLVLAPVAGVLGAGGEAETDPAKAGPDFAFQGEYVGEVGGEKWGGQVIALGDGTFRGVGYKGGLPGDGWKRGDDRHVSEGKASGGAVVMKGDDHTATIKDGLITIADGDGNKLGELRKVDRKSPTLGQKAPAGAVVLFDGSSADQFNNGKLVEGNLLGATNCESKLKVGDHTLHIEFRTPFMPKSRGQGRGNSGVYIQSRYECQVLEPLQWQTYDITYTVLEFDAAGAKTKNARITVVHNGVTVHDDLELPTVTPGGVSGEEAVKGVLMLQDHDNPVSYRNIWFKSAE